MTEAERLDLLCINTLRTLSIDAVQKANSGHPGTPMGAAPIAYCLWQRFLRFDPDDPDWPNRDRFVLSVGHASVLLYCMLHLCGREGHGTALRRRGTPRRDDARLQTFRQARQPVHRPPRIRLDLGRRDDHRAARPGSRD